MPQTHPYLNRSSCPHHKNDHPTGMALISIGNSLRGDDGLARALCNRLPLDKNCYCYFDLGNFSNLIGECLQGHRAAIIIDSMQTRTTPGTVSVLDLKCCAQTHPVLQIKASHGLSLLDEIRIAANKQPLPEKLLFFGVEIDSWGWSENLSKTIEELLPEITAKLQAEIDLLQNSEEEQHSYA